MCKACYCPYFGMKILGNGLLIAYTRSHWSQYRLTHWNQKIKSFGPCPWNENRDPWSGEYSKYCMINDGIFQLSVAIKCHGYRVGQVTINLPVDSMLSLSLLASSRSVIFFFFQNSINKYINIAFLMIKKFSFQIQVSNYCRYILPHIANVYFLNFFIPNYHKGKFFGLMKFVPGI